MFVRVAMSGLPAFQLKKGEEGISIFDRDAVSPALHDVEILDQFRPGSHLVFRSRDEIETKGLRVVPVPGAEPLTQRLQLSHAEIRPGTEMTRLQFKQALKELE
jgi:hypothetical protein